MSSTSNVLKDGPGVETRTGRALFHWINPTEVRPLYHASSVSDPADVDCFWSAWQARMDGAGIGPVSLATAVEPLPAELRTRAEELKASEQFKAIYQPLGSDFAMVSVESLVTPQWWLDTDYVDELVATLPSEDDLAGLFEFCMASGTLGSPLLLGTNGAILTSHKADLGGVSPLRVGKMVDGRVTFEFDAVARPNWLWLSVVPDNGSVLILNGVHHVAALQKDNRPKAIAMIRMGTLNGVLNAQDPGIYKPERLVCQRPPIVRDFYDDSLSDVVRIRAVDRLMRFAVNPEFGVIPRSAA